jgi:DNA invertase Pin-like site-specific DNA recombinase
MKRNRPALSRLLSALKEGDTLVCVEVTRLARSLSQVLEILSFIETNKITLMCGGLSLDGANAPAEAVSMFTIQILAAAGEFERKLIVARVRSGIANARAKGITLGRPKRSLKSIPKKVKHLHVDYLKGKINKVQYAEKCGITRPTLDKYLVLLADEVVGP